MKSGQRQTLRMTPETPLDPAKTQTQPATQIARRRTRRSASWLECATSSAQAERWTDVLAETAQCLRRDADCLPALELRAKALWRLGRYGELDAVTRSMLRINQHEPGYRLLQALAQLGTGRFARAATLLRNLADHTKDAEIRQIATENLLMLQVHEEAMHERLGFDRSTPHGPDLGIVPARSESWPHAPLQAPSTEWTLPWRRN